MTQIDTAKECGVSFRSYKQDFEAKKGHWDGWGEHRREYWRKRKKTKNEDFLIRESKLNPRKTSLELQQDLALTSIEVYDSTVRKTIYRSCKKNKQSLTVAVDSCHVEETQ